MKERDLLSATYRAFNARNVDAVLAVMHPDVDWPNGMEGGRVHGHAAVREYWSRQWAVIDPHVEPRRFGTDETRHVVVDVHQVVRDLAGKVLADQMVQHIYHIEDGLIRSMEIRTP
jgi:ketosteroid isomerase-like protein